MSEAATSAGPGWWNLETVFASLGRVLIVLDADFQIVRASRSLDQLVESGASARVIGKPVEELIGARLFSPTGTLREALKMKRREEGRRGVLLCGTDSARLVSITAAPVAEGAFNHCDPRARYLVVIRPAEEDDDLLQSAIVTHGLVTRSGAMRKIVHLVESLHHSDATVLITGESGVGKEVIARALHAQSPHSGGAFVPVNCAALPSQLLESELFGHVRGAFTGAVKDRAGRFDLARGGTLFLDEVGDIPPEVQVKLLRVLQAKTYERVGESTQRKLEARLVAATNVDLKEAIRAGKFREDLYYRLRVVPIHIPPLRERPEDIGLIAQHLLAHIGGREGRALKLSPDTLHVLERYPWPGNVRELENSLEYAVALCRGQNIQLEDMPVEIREFSTQPDKSEFLGVPARLISSDARESARILGILERSRWNHSRAARELGMSRTTLWRRMKELGISEEPNKEK